MAYTPPPGNSITFNFVEGYEPADGNSLVFNFGGDAAGVYPAGISPLPLGLAHVQNLSQGVTSFGLDSALFGTAVLSALQRVTNAGNVPPGFAGSPIFSRPPYQELIAAGILGYGAGAPSVKNGSQPARPLGIPAGAFGTATLYKLRQYIQGSGFTTASRFGTTTKAYNLRQYLPLGGFASQAFAPPYVAGGVKTVTLAGFASQSLGTPKVVNTKATRTLSVPGVPTALKFGSPVLSPRRIWLNGITAPGFGVPRAWVPPRPLGFIATLFGGATIEYKTKRITPNGLTAGESVGYPKVFDPTRKVLAISLTTSAIFGDVRARNKNLFVRATGFNAAELSEWATVESNRRHLLTPGLLWTDFGTASAKNKTPSLAPLGFDAFRPSSPTETGIGFQVRTIHAVGAPRKFGVGTPAVIKTPEIGVSGINRLSFGGVTVWHRHRLFEIPGFGAARHGEPVVWFKYRTLPLEGFREETFGRPRAEHGRRSVLFTGYVAQEMGRPWVSLRNRYVSVPSIEEIFKATHMVGGLRFLRPAGFIATTFGERIIPESQQIYLQGFREIFGLAKVESRWQLAKPPAFGIELTKEGRWGFTKVHNSRQYVFQFFDGDNGLVPPAWPVWTRIENRNKVIGALGFNAHRSGNEQIDNKARPIIPPGINPPALPAKAGMVSHRIRYLPVQGLEQPYMSGWAVVYNDARLIKPNGLDASSIGVAALVNTRRYFKYIGAMLFTEFGSPMVADRVRGIGFDSRYTIAPPIIRLPEVKLYTRHITGIGFDVGKVGWASLEIRFTRVTPRWTVQNFYGVPTVKNLTPEVRTKGRNAEEFGAGDVRLQWRPVEPVGEQTTRIGKVDIAYRDRNLFLNGMLGGLFGLTKVIKSGLPPLSPQFIDLNAANDDQDGLGIPIPDRQVGDPYMNQQVVYPEGLVFTRMGGHTVTANSIRVEPGYGEYLFSDPTVSYKNREIAVFGVRNDITFGKPRLTPHTIYAPSEGTNQAKQNHPTGETKVIDSVVAFGRITVALRHRIARASSLGNQTSFGFPTLYLKLKYVNVQSFSTLRVGWITIPGGLNEIKPFDPSDTAEVGRPSLSRPPYLGPRTLTVGVGSSMLFGRTQIELFNRTLPMTGFKSEAMGTGQPGDNPYQWQRLRVGPLMPTIPEGFNAERPGTQWVSHRIREVVAEGFDAGMSEYDLEMFFGRMRVRRVDPPRPSRSVAPVGFDAFRTNASNVLPAVHFIRPDGNADMFRKGFPQ